MTSFVAHCNQDGIWTRWLSPEEFSKKYPNLTPNYRSRNPNEVILESDFPEKRTNYETMRHAAKILKEKGYSYRLFDSGGKGYHLHIYFGGDEQ